MSSGAEPGPRIIDRLAFTFVRGSEPDARLAQLVRAGARPAFEAIVHRHRQPLVRYAAGIVGRDAADEVVQEALVCAHAALLRGDEVASLRAWLYRIVRNKALNLVRDRGPAGVPLDEAHAALDTPEASAERRQTLSTVVAAVQQLPVKQRDAIVLRELEGRSYGEIAGRLGVSDPAVRGLLSRARVTLRRAAAAFAPLWPSRMAEIWAAGAPGSQAARACATGLAAAVVTFGGIEASSDRPADEHSPARAAAGAPAREGAEAPQSTGATSVRPVRATAPVVPVVERAAAVVAASEAPAREAATGIEATIREPEPRSDHRREQLSQEARPRRDEPTQPRETYSSEQPSPERRMRTADAQPLDFHKSQVGEMGGDATRREFSR